MFSQDYTNRIYTLEEYLALTKESDNRYELIGGYVYMMASPSATHQRLVLALAREYAEFFEDKPCEAFIAPFDVYLYEEDDSCSNVFQPDVFVVCDKDKIKERGCEGAPDLAIEVASKSSLSLDYMVKCHHYMRLGVKAYWIVNPETRQTTVYTKQNDELSVRAYSFDEAVNSGLFDGLTINLKDLGF